MPALLLAQAAHAPASVDLGNVLLGAGGLTTAAVGVVVVLWRKLEAREAELVAARKDARDELAAANAKLDAFQDARIKEQSELIKALSGGNHP